MTRASTRFWGVSVQTDNKWIVDSPLFNTNNTTLEASLHPPIPDKAHLTSLGVCKHCRQVCLVCHKSAYPNNNNNNNNSWHSWCLSFPGGSSWSVAKQSCQCLHWVGELSTVFPGLRKDCTYVHYDSWYSTFWIRSDTWLHSVHEIAVPISRSPQRSWWGLVLAETLLVQWVTLHNI